MKLVGTTITPQDSTIELNFNIGKINPFVPAQITLPKQLQIGNDGKFFPNDYIKRQDAAVILHRLVSEMNFELTQVDFNDNYAISDYAKDAVLFLAGSGVIAGMDNGNFEPMQNLTRAQAAKLLCGVMELLD